MRVTENKGQNASDQTMMKNSQDMPEPLEPLEDDLTDEDLDVPQPTENGAKNPSCSRYVYPPGFMLKKRHLFTLLPTSQKMHKDITKDADDNTSMQPDHQWQRGRSVTTPRLRRGRPEGE